jgi:hypothetical protein
MTVGDPGVLNALGAERQVVRIMSEEHAAFRMSMSELDRVVRS